MKKTFKIVVLLLVGLFFIPKVWAEELPTEGVHYFLTYPDGSEEVIDSYQDANDPKEKLIFTGNTNANGEVLLCDWAGEGELRIVQKVPNGYSTDKEELRVSLGRDTKVEFVDFKMSNPYTGNSFWMILGIIGVTVIGAYCIKKGHKKVLFIVPIALFGFFAYRAYAANCFQIRIVDKQGNPLSNVEVLVYSKPIAVEASPAIIFDANGGKFLDGSTQFFVKIPFDGCSFDDFMNSLSEEEMQIFHDKMRTVYRKNYYPYINDIPEYLYNGDIIYFDWERDGGARTIDLDGNGGSTSIGGSVYRRVTSYVDRVSYLIHMYPFVNGDQVLIGWDDNPECSHYDSNGVGNVPLPIQRMINSEVIKKEGAKHGVINNYDYPDTIYACWNSNPDGIFIDEEKFVGSVGTCYSQSSLDFYDDEYRFYNNDSSFNYYDNGNLVYVSFGIQKGFGPLNPATPSQMNSYSLPVLNANGDESFHTLRIVENGQVILTITEDDLAEDVDGYVYIANPEKANALREYFSGLNYCINTD